MERKHLFAIISLAISVLILGGCGYTLEGRASLLPAHILRVGIPTLDNSTTMPALGEVVTDAIYSEFVTRGNFRVTNSEAGVDALLEGEVTHYTLVPRALDDEGMATSFLVMVSANVVFRDLIEDKILWEQEGYRFQREYQLSDIGGDMVTQEMESIRLVAKDFANSLVGSILTGF